MSRHWPTVALSEVLAPAIREETVDALKKYRLLGIRLDGQGPFLRETVLGTETAAARLYRVAEGDFIYSRLFAWRGAFGVVSSELDGCYVSAEFPVFRPVAKKIDVRFLAYWFLLKSTLERIAEDCSGSTPLTRNRFKEPFFLRLEIPVPPLDEQHRMLSRIDAIAARIQEVRFIYEREDAELQAMLFSAFHRVIRGALCRPMEEVAPLVRRSIEVDPQGSYPELGIRSFGRGTFHKPSLSGLEVGSKRIFRIEPGDLLFSNVFAWEGAIAVAKPQDAGRAGSHRFITCVPQPDVASAQFLCFFFLTEEGLNLIRAASPGGALRNRTLGLEALGKIQVPVPSLDKQRWFDELQAKVQSLRSIRAQSALQIDALLAAIVHHTFNGGEDCPGSGTTVRARAQELFSSL